MYSKAESIIGNMPKIIDTLLVLTILLAQLQEQRRCLATDGVPNTALKGWPRQVQLKEQQKCLAIDGAPKGIDKKRQGQLEVKSRKKDTKAKRSNQFNEQDKSSKFEAKVNIQNQMLTERTLIKKAKDLQIKRGIFQFKDFRLSIIFISCSFMKVVKTLISQSERSQFGSKFQHRNKGHCE